jgi:hydroxymethylpyrimidine pyrophosphatase-like HAD family hydrolase
MKRKPVVAFDVDGTLLREDDSPREEMVTLLMMLVPYCRVVVWSGCGLDYAAMQGRRLKLPDGITYMTKTGGFADISIDDQDVNLATVNIMVADEE